MAYGHKFSKRIIILIHFDYFAKTHLHISTPFINWLRSTILNTYHAIALAYQRNCVEVVTIIFGTLQVELLSRGNSVFFCARRRFTLITYIIILRCIMQINNVHEIHFIQLFVERSILWALELEFCVGCNIRYA